MIDVGDEASSLAATKGSPRFEVAALFGAQRFVEYRARGVVVRGLGHVGAIAARPWSRPSCLVPDVCTASATWTPTPRSGTGLVLGFIGSSFVSPKAPPAGWELPELLRLLPMCQGLAVLAGPGEAQIRRRAAELRVDDRLRILPPGPPEQLNDVLERVEVCLSTQTTNLAGHVRTTGKLVQYLSAGKVVIASRAGTAAAILPPMLTVDKDNVFSADYVRALASRVEAVASMADDDFLELQRYSRALAVRLFNPTALAPLWLDKMREWGVLQ
ncbi:MAG: hypothetical protein M3Z84_05340 [Actinomycetota bacterium]|nr:hypothetical protein [Actinomycetota bacterium]